MFSDDEIKTINQAIRMEKKVNRDFNLRKNIFGCENDILSLNKAEIFQLTTCLSNLIRDERDRNVESIINKLLRLID